MVLDDFTDMTWSFFIKSKDEQVEPMMDLFRSLNKRGTPVKHIRCDNAGENLLLEQAIKKDPVLNVTMEYTPRDSPQYNGRIERKFAWYWQGTRANLNAAMLPDAIRKPLWSAAANYTESVGNVIVTRRKAETGCS